MTRIALILLFALALLPSASDAQTLVAAPTRAAPGAMFFGNAEGLATGSSYRIFLERGQPFTARWQLSEFTAADSDASRKLVVPAAASAGAYHLVLYLTSGAERARTAFTVGSALALTLQPTSAAPGKSVLVTVSGTRAGTLTLNYAGGKVLGPVAVRDGSWSGRFIVPRDRPASLPATVVVEAINHTGRFIAARGKANFSALAPSGLPTIRSSFTTPPPPREREGRAFTFAGRMQQDDDTASAGRTSFFWRGDDGHVVPIDGGVETAADGSYTLQARTPSFFMDGVAAGGGGTIVGVTRDDDPHTGSPRDIVTATGHTFVTDSSFDPGTGQFVIRLRGVNQLGQNAPIRGAYVRVYGDLQEAFSDPNDGVPPPSDDDFIGYDSQFSLGQASAGMPNGLAQGGCPVTFGAKFTNDAGEAVFEINKDKLQQLIMRQALAKLGEVRVVDHGAPIPGEDVFLEDIVNGGQPGKGGSSGDETYLTMEVFAGPQGFGETGIRDVDGNPDFPPYDNQPGIVPTYVNVAVDLTSGEVRLDGGVGQFGTTNGSETSPGVFTVNMERINPATTSDVVPYSLRIAGLAPPTGNLTKVFRGMHAFPNTGLWPDGVFSQRNAGREMRFTWDVGFGTASTPQLLLATNCPSGTSGCQPSLQPVATFQLDSNGSCNVEGEIDYVAALPDLTRLQIPSGNADVCYPGRIVIERVGVDAAQDFRLCTRRPPPEMNAQNTQLQASTFRIDARATRYVGNLALPHSQVTGDDPRMREYDLPPQENESDNDGSFVTAVDTAGAVVDDFAVATDHLIGNNGTDATNVGTPGLFGFTGNQQVRSQIDRQTVLDTGKIPLFRYPWGFSPIAGAVLGADFWLGADVGFYGTLGNPTGNGTLMDATIDPRMEGGVDMFFDLDILFGVISASVSALPSLDLTLRETMGRGGMFPVANDNAGVCYGFDLDAEMEICALFCASDRFNLFRVQDGAGCNTNKDGKAYGRGEFDLRPPTPRPAAIAADASGNEVVVRVDARGALVAEHMQATELEARRVIDSATTGVQHVDAVYLGVNRILAVWSESRLSETELRTLMTPTLGYNPVREGSAALARSMRLRWSYFDGSTWSAPQAYGPDGNVGKPRLAACRSLLVLNGCSSRTPRAYLVYERDRNGNVLDPAIEVHGASFAPGTGFGGSRLLSASGANNLHPDVAYLGGTPVATWVSISGPAYGPPSRRQIAYRIVDDDARFAAQLLAGSPGAGWPTIATRGSDEIVLAFTRAQDASLVGNRNALTLARGTRCGTGTCTWQVTEPRDPAGRQIRGERPSLTIESDGTAAVQFRGLAYGPTANGTLGLATDAPGMLMGTGDLLSLRVGDFSRATTTVATQNLSGNGLLSLRPDFVYDAALDAYVGLAHEAVQPQLPASALEFSKKFAPKGFDAITAAKAVGDGGLMMRNLAMTPDFRIESLRVAAPWLAAGASTTYQVTIRNVGAAYDPAEHGTAQLLAAWDAAPGAGIAAASPFALAAPLAANATLTLTRSVAAPASDHFPDQRRMLHVEARPADTMEDGNGIDNLERATIGDMPVPQGLVARIKTGLGSMGLDWEAGSDPRIAGYRVYKRAENGEFVPYGSSASSGYIDVFAGFRNVEYYRVTSYSERGVESEPSAILIAAPERIDGVFANGFEGAGG